jgi:DMSO/TMAO reductase YedYZ heme-binding membrane subunit
MFGISFLDISGSMGLLACGTLTLNSILGMFLGTQFKNTTYWKQLPAFVKKYPIIDLHNFTAYTAIGFVCLHLVFLLLHQENGFTLFHLINPLNAPKQPTIVLLGVLSFYSLIVILITSQKFIRKELSFRTWKNIHLIAYATSFLFLIHGLLMDPLLKDRPTDWLDAEKIFVEGCAIIFIIAVFLRVRFHLNDKKGSI